VTPQGRCRVVVVGDPPSGVGGVDRRRQRTEQLAETAFALPQCRLRTGSIKRHDITARRWPSKRGDHLIKFTFQKTEFAHFLGIPRTQY
jgi:hypothetical protein